MCECICGEQNIDAVYSMPDDPKLLAYEIYKGCEQCFKGIGVAMYVFPNQQDFDFFHFRPSTRTGTFQPDTYGGNGGQGISVGLFEIKDLEDEAEELTKEADVGSSEDFSTLKEWLHEYGLALIQGAMRRFKQRIDPHL